MNAKCQYFSFCRVCSENTACFIEDEWTALYVRLIRDGGRAGGGGWGWAGGG